MRVILSLLVFSGLWEAALQLASIPSFLLPCPSDILKAFWTQGFLLFSHGGTTLLEVGLGFILGSLAGIALSFCLVMSPLAYRWIFPIFVLLQSVPMFALLPVICLVIGFGLASKIVVVALTVYFPVVVTFVRGLMAPSPVYEELCAVSQAKPWYAFWFVHVPKALPALFSGLLIAAMHAPVAVLAADWIGASSGIGYVILLAAGRLEMPLMFAAILCLAVMGGALYAIIRRCQQSWVFWS